MATVKVRIAVVVCPNGHWNACGWYAGNSIEDNEFVGLALEGISGEGEERVYWLTADLRIPEQDDIQASVEPEGE